MQQLDKAALDLKGLSIDALALAVRPGRSLEQILSIVDVLGKQARASSKSDDDGEDRGSRRVGDRLGRAKVKGLRSDGDRDDPVGTLDGIDIVQPERLVETSGEEPRAVADLGQRAAESNLVRQLRVKTLSGYGDA